MAVMTETKLKQMRKALDLTQEDFAIMAGLRINTYRTAEQRGRTSYPTAQSILRALNTSRVARGMPVITLEDLELDIV